MRLTFPPEARLQHRRDFERVYAHGQPLRHRLVVLYQTPSANGPEAATRFGITVSKKVSKRATVRNRVRRALREAARLARPRLGHGFDIVLNARKIAALEITGPKALAALIQLAAQGGLLAVSESP